MNLDLYDYEAALDEAHHDFMSHYDELSFLFYRGFINKSIELSPNKKEIMDKYDLNLDPYEMNFHGVRGWVVDPMKRCFLVYYWYTKHNITLHSKDPMHTEFVKMFRVIKYMSHMLTDVPDRLHYVNDINQNITNFIMVKGWPLSYIEVWHENHTEIREHFNKMFEYFADLDLEYAGQEAAEIANILHHITLFNRTMEDYSEERDEMMIRNITWGDQLDFTYGLHPDWHKNKDSFHVEHVEHPNKETKYLDRRERNANHDNDMFEDSWDDYKEMNEKNHNWILM